MRVGIDIGGTFTDFVVTSRAEGRILIDKRLTTTEDPSIAVLEGLSALLRRVGRPPGDLDVVIHATTLVTNTVIERTGARIGLITTGGFRDILEIGNELRYDLYDLFMRMPEPLVPRFLRKGVGERTLADGTILTPLDRAGAETIVVDLLREGVEAIAVCLLHSYANPENERALREVIAAIDPAVPVTISSDLLPEIREYERTLATVINAYVQPKIRAYLRRLAEGLEKLGIGAPLYIMQSSGGLTTVEQAASVPVTINESGPAAGAICAARMGKIGNLDRLISFDMGGTTAKTCLIQDGRPSISVELEFARLERFKKGSGFPIRVSTVELVEIGAGGGSIAWIDEMGLLKVGPRSAGSKPGPAAYGLGGTEPTVTDADLVLGYLSPEHFLGGEMRLDLDQAKAAIETRIATPLGLSIVEAAWGIHQIVNENMALASRIHIVERGEDPRTFTVVAFGGAGPVHAQAMASKLGAGRIMFPVAAGAASALGLLLAEPSGNYVRTYLHRLDSADWSHVEDLYDEMRSRGVAALSDLVGDEWKTVRTIDLRYAGQGYELNIPLPDERLSAATSTSIADAFNAAYARSFGRSMDGGVLDIVNLRLAICGEAARLDGRLTIEGRTGSGRQPPRREAYFGAEHGFLECAVLDRYALASESSGVGPAIIEERESTIIVAPGQRWNVDAHGNIVIEIPVHEIAEATDAQDVSTDFENDPISLEIAWGRLQSIVDEAAAGLIRTAFSPIIREGKDFTVMLLDRTGHSIVQSTQSIPAFIGTMPRTMRAMLDKFPLEEWQPGDVVGTNDPWLGAGHLPDVNLAQPIFRGGRLVAFAGVIAHMADIGGRGLASDSREVFEEGLRIPICRFRRKSEPNRELYDIIADNVRLPRQVLGDIEAMIAVGFQIEERLQPLLDELGVDDVDGLGRAIQGRSEKAMRQAIAQVPVGTYRDMIPVDGLGQDLQIAAAVTFDGSKIIVDFEGSSPQIQGGINSTFGFSYSYTAYALKCLLSPHLPINDGTFRPIRMVAPEGTIIHCRPPAAVAARSQVGHYISGAIYGALASVMPEKVIADSGSPRPMIVLNGRNDAGEPFVTTVLVHGGMGATSRHDGLPCIAFPTNTAGIPVEVVEATTPVLVEEKEFVTDSGGTGQFRGGLGQRIVLRMLSNQPTRVSILGQRDRFAPRGLFEGGPGRKLHATLNDEEPINVHGVTMLKKDDRVVVDAPGGGGFGPLAGRAPDAIHRDLKNGVISPQSMRRKASR